jgi:hypothetical protein
MSSLSADSTVPRKILQGLASVKLSASAATDLDAFVYHNEGLAFRASVIGTTTAKLNAEVVVRSQSSAQTAATTRLSAVSSISFVQNAQSNAQIAVSRRRDLINESSSTGTFAAFGRFATGIRSSANATANLSAATQVTNVTYITLTALLVGGANNPTLNLDEIRPELVFSPVQATLNWKSVQPVLELERNDATLNFKQVVQLTGKLNNDVLNPASVQPILQPFREVATTAPDPRQPILEFTDIRPTLRFIDH